MNHRVWVLRLTSCKMLSGFDVEDFQLSCDDLDSFNGSPVVCLDAWNQLKWSRTLTGVAAEMTSNLKSDLVILRFWIMCECLISSGMMFMKCWNNWFEWKCFPSQNSIVTWFWSKVGRFERDWVKTWTQDVLV